MAFPQGLLFCRFDSTNLLPKYQINIEGRQAFSVTLVIIIAAGVTCELFTFVPHTTLFILYFKSPV